MSTYYDIFCSTENKIIRGLSDEPLNTCPNDPLHEVDLSSVKLVGYKLHKLIVSTHGFSDYRTIDEAFAANQNNQNQLIEVYPGTYTVNNPITIPPGCSIKSNGSPGTTTIMALNPDKPIFIMNNFTKIVGFNLTGVTSSAAIDHIATTDIKILYIKECIFTDCENGIQIDGTDFMIIVDCIFMTNSRNCNSALICKNGGLIVASNIYIAGNQNYSFTNGCLCMNSSSKISLTTVSIILCNNGLNVNNDGEFEVSLLTIRYCNNGIYIDSTGTLSSLNLRSLNIISSLSYDINIQSTNAFLNIFSARCDEHKINNPNNVNINIQYISGEQLNNKSMAFIGNIKYGTTNSNSIASFGQGNYQLKSAVLASDTTFTSIVDNSNSAQLNGSSTFNLFNDITVDNCVYIGSENNIPGIYINVNTPISSITSIDNFIWEYWNGTSWLKLNFMQTDTTSPYLIYSDNSVLSYANEYNIRFNTSTTSNFSLLTIGSYNYKWIRLRIIDPPSSNPVIDSIFVHCNQSQINGDGYLEHFGDSRVVDTLPININNLNVNSTASSTSDYYITKNIYATIPKKEFTLLNNIKMSLLFNVPRNIDISYPIKATFYFIGSTDVSGNISWKIKSAYSKSGDEIHNDDSTAPNTLTYEDNYTMTTSVLLNNKNIILKETFLIDLCKMHVNPRPNDNNNNLIWFELERDSTENDLNDTYDGNINVINIDFRYVKWCEGSTITAY